MSIISGVTVNWTTSPRIITIPNSETSINIEDLQDTLLGLEDDPEGMVYPHLRATSGGEALGGGTSVGYTMELQNARLAFAQRVVELESGTVTTPDTDGMVLIDSTATFSSNGVVAGDVVRNRTDGSIAGVVTVDSEIQLTVTTLEGGSDNQFDNSDSYDVMDWISCAVTGGNLVAVNDVGAEIDPIYPTFGTTVTRASSSSATTQEQTDIQYSSYDGGVTVDTITGTSGTDFPMGTGREPVDNITDAVTIAQARGFHKLYIKGDITLTTGDDCDEMCILGENTSHSLVTVEAGADVTNCAFRDCTVTGTLDGGNIIKDCAVQTLNYVNGTIVDSVFGEYTITLGGGAIANMLNCYSGVAGSSTPIIDMGGSGQNLSVRAYSGGIKVTNCTGAGNKVSLDFISGHANLDSTITNGDIKVRGVGELTDSTTGSAVVDSDGLITGDAVGLTDDQDRKLTQNNLLTKTLI